ncbi:MAG: ThiF family adenylyltransferase [bacterium]|nr:ThiF family adenylyltransferase [bacterium]
MAASARRRAALKPVPAVEVDYWRQLDIFSPEKFTTPVTVIGAGATGSWITLLLAKMGVRDITVYDFDVVENHNIPNQIFGLADVGRLKVEALADAVKAATGISIKPIAKRFTNQPLTGIVFVLTDTMASRKQMWEESIRAKRAVTLLIETRLGAEGGYVFAIRPTLPKQIMAYEQRMFSDEEAEESPCTRRAIAPTVATIAGIAVYTLVSFATDQPYVNETMISLSPPFAQTKKF